MPHSAGRAEARPRITSSDTLLERLKKLHPQSIDLSLGRIERLLAALGHPEEKLPPVLHVAGTNGKGSFLAFTRAIAEGLDKGVHVYTSPHLVNFHERIVLAGPHGSAPIGEDHLVDCLARAEAANGGELITLFEITTAAAFLAFADVPGTSADDDTDLSVLLDGLLGTLVGAGFLRVYRHRFGIDLGGLHVVKVVVPRCEDVENNPSRMGRRLFAGVTGTALP